MASTFIRRNSHDMPPRLSAGHVGQARPTGGRRPPYQVIIAAPSKPATAGTRVNPAVIGSPGKQVRIPLRDHHGVHNPSSFVKGMIDEANASMAETRPAWSFTEQKPFCTEKKRHLGSPARKVADGADLGTGFAALRIQPCAFNLVHSTNASSTKKVRITCAMQRSFPGNNSKQSVVLSWQR
jgi:hypothetical protein